MINKHKDVIVLISRILIGAIFVYAGWIKVSNPPFVVQFFASMGLPSFIAYIVSYAEILGGIALVLGLWVELASCGLIIIMIGAVYFGITLTQTNGLGSGQAFQLIIQTILPNIAIISALVAQIATGPGKFSIQKNKMAMSLSPEM